MRKTAVGTADQILALVGPGLLALLLKARCERRVSGIGANECKRWTAPTGKTGDKGRKQMEPKHMVVRGGHCMHSEHLILLNQPVFVANDAQMSSRFEFFASHFTHKAPIERRTSDLPLILRCRKRWNRSDEKLS